MSTQTDVKAVYVNATGAAGVGAAATASSPARGVRIKGMWLASPVSAGSVVITDGTSTGPTLLKVDTAAVISDDYMLIPGEGIRSVGDLFVTLTNVTSVTIFYG